jgi:hypothetical protein
MRVKTYSPSIYLPTCPTPAYEADSFSAIEDIPSLQLNRTSLPCPQQLHTGPYYKQTKCSAHSNTKCPQYLFQCYPYI